jgi:myo-inositol-1(or 4)-monophosphatase
MFLHWGLFSITSRGVWRMFLEHVPHEEYRPLADEFDASRYRPADWVAIARDAGDLIMRYYKRPLAEDTKSSDYDLVTEADQATERQIVGALLAEYPDHHIVGEEGGGMGAPRESVDHFWYVDPIDGTTNFASKIPHFCVNLALTDRDFNTLVAVTYNPCLDEMFSAVKGAGATLNGEKMCVSQAETLQQSVVASGFGYDKWTNPDNNAAEWGAFVSQTRGVRRMGSAALDFAYVAAGRYDGYWERHLHDWDFMAGVLLVREAGGQVTDYNGDPSTEKYANRRFLATNGHIHAAMMDVLAEVARMRA